MLNTQNGLELREISAGVAEVYDASNYQVGLITWNPDRMTTQWFATYANADETVPCSDRNEAVNILRLQHVAVQRFARSLRSIRPAPELRVSARDVTWDKGYNSALRDVERITQEAVGTAPDGEGFTAITRH